MADANRTDEDLLEAYCQGDLQAFEVFFRRHLARVCSYAVKKGIARDDASEVAQEVFLKLHLHIVDYEIGKKALPWFFTIVHHACIDWLRRFSRAKKYRVDCPIADFEAVPAVFVASREFSGPGEPPLHMIQSLPAQQRQVVEMRIMDELSFQEISKETGRTEVSLRKSYSRSLEFLRKLMSKKEQSL